jgi:predicted permease
MLTDLRFAVRVLLKDRSFTLTALLTLAICIAANTAMFSIVRSVLLKPLPFPGSERMVYLYNSYPNAGAPRVGAAVPDFFDRQRAVPALEEQAIFRQEGMTFGDDNSAERLTSIRGTPSLYRLLRVVPEIGRVFTDQEGEPGQESKVILSHGFWLRKFGGDQSIAGRMIRLNGNPFEVVGVMPMGFSLIQNDFDIFLPAAFTPAQMSDGQRHNNNWQMIGRLKQGATIDVVRQQVDALNARNDDRFPEFRQILKDAHFRTFAVFLQDDVVRDVKAGLYLLWGCVLFVLVIGCVNIANLVIVRSSGRAREMATRHAIGGDLSRLARQLLTETTLLALAGGAIGILLGWYALRSVSVLNLDQLPRGYEIALDPIAVAVILGLTLAVGLAIGVAPVVRLRRMNLNVELREENRGGTSGRRGNLVRRSLAMLQVAIALVLLTGAGLLVFSFRAIMHLDFGFSPDNVMTAAVSLPATAYKDAAALVTFGERSLDAIRAISGVEAAGLTTVVPFSGNVNNSVILAEGYVMKPGESLLAPTTVIVSAGYFEAMRIPVLRGRAFDRRDTAVSTRAVIVDERMAKKFWPDQDPIGRRMYTPSDLKDHQRITPDTQFMTVVGVAKEVQLIDPRPDVTPVGVVYLPFPQQQPIRALTFIVRTRTPSTAIGSGITQAVSGLDPQLPVYRVRTMQEWIDRALVGRRVPMLIAMAFGVVALLLAAVGIYGVLAYGVAQRQREIGVRLALGGTAAGVFGLVLRDGLRIVGIGVAVGLASSATAGQLMKSQLFNVAPMDPVVLGGGTAALVVVALIATMIPAWRASRIDPIVALGR